MSKGKKSVTKINGRKKAGVGRKRERERESRKVGRQKQNTYYKVISKARDWGWRDDLEINNADCSYLGSVPSIYIMAHNNL